ncbi:50S ribosomal protein L21e [Candidatus Woesearchaeota archaeon B3_Woes]|nr:MAG: 50S ribosomal protein L21e [Candidatus Woesearchaeota archaeon B3_Woes]
MNRKGGPRRKSRQKLTGKIRKRGKINIRGFFQSFKEGDKVQLVADSSYQRGMFPLRFYGKMGVVKSKQGRAYYVAITDQNKEKSVIVHPIHLKKI